MDQAKGIVRLLEEERNRLTKELRGVTAAIAAFGKAYTQGTGRRQLSAGARARIAAAQRARWAKTRKSAVKGQAKVVPIRRRRTVAPTTRRKIAAAQRARWARARATKKTA